MRDELFELIRKNNNTIHEGDIILSIRGWDKLPIGYIYMISICKNGYLNGFEVKWEKDFSKLTPQEFIELNVPMDTYLYKDENDGRYKVYELPDAIKSMFGIK